MNTKQKWATAIIIPVTAFITITAITSPNNQNRTTEADVQADTSHHARAQYEGNVKFNGDSPDVEQSIRAIRELSANPELSKAEKVERVKALANGSEVSTIVLSQYTNSLVLSVRNRTLLDDKSETGRLIELYRAELVAIKNNYAGFNGEFAKDYVSVQENLYRYQNAQNSDDVNSLLERLDSNVNQVEY
jgi:hypothetical protein